MTAAQTIGFIGSGMISSQLARPATAAGYDVVDIGLPAAGTWEADDPRAEFVTQRIVVGDMDDVNGSGPPGLHTLC